MTTKTSIAVVGIGAMGSRLAANYAAAGHPLTVWNRSPTATKRFENIDGITVATTAEEAAASADVVVSMLADDTASREVWLGQPNALSAIKPGAVLVESSTLTSNTISELANAAASASVKFIEAPVLGSTPQAETGALFYLFGGDKQLIEDVWPVLEVNAGGKKRVGDIGEAAVIKLAINGLLAIQVAAYAEVVGLLDRSSLDTAESIELLSKLPITAPKIQGVLTKFAEQQFEPNFPIHLVAKDLRYLSHLAQDIGASIPIGNATSTVYQDGKSNEIDDLDISAVAKLYLAKGPIG